MVQQDDLFRLRSVITENLRVQLGGTPIDYISVGTVLQDACSKQNHTIFARRGCGKTLLLHHSSRALPDTMRSVYLNCEEFKKHSFPNVLIEILHGIFRELDRNLRGWFGKKKRSKEIIKEIVIKLQALQQGADIRDEQVKNKVSSEIRGDGDVSANLQVDHFNMKIGARRSKNEREEVERSFQFHEEKLQELDRWLPDLKQKAIFSHYPQI